MPITQDGYETLDGDEIQQMMENSLEGILGMTAEPGDLVTAQLQSEAETIADNIEKSLQKVYEAAYLDDASGEELDKLVDLIGLTRKRGLGATGVSRFSRADPPTSDYTIPRGTLVQTGGVNPIVFETTEISSIEHIDGFEDQTLNNWEGDTGSTSVVSSNDMTGNYVLEMPATSGVAINSVKSFKIGTIFDIDLRPQGDSVIGFRFQRENGSNYKEVVLNIGSNDLRIREVADGSQERQETVNVPLSANDTVHLEVEWSLYGDDRATLYASSSKQTEIETIYLEDQGYPDLTEGDIGIVSKGDAATTHVDEIATSATTIPIEAVETGIQTNVSADSIDILTNGMSGINSVTNPVPTGNPKFLNTNRIEFISGREREGDEDLRERALNNTVIGGSATTTAIGSALQKIDGVQSVELFKNKTENEKDGLPSHSYEAVIHGGTKEEIAKVLHNTSAIDSQDYGGAHGDKVTYTITDDVLASTETYSWSTPAELTLNISVDLIIDDTYIGDEDVKSLIIGYIGGTDIDGSFIPGTNPGEDVYEAVVKNRIVDPSEHGIWEVDSLTIDKDGDGTDDTTSLGSGADVLEVQSSEIAQTNARDSSITVNTNTK